MGYKVGELARSYWRTLVLVRHSLLTIAAMLSLGYTTRYSGLDATLGLDIDFVGGELQFLLGTLDLGLVTVSITENSISANETSLVNVVLTLAPSLFPSLADSLGTFPLPDFLGLQLGLVEIGKLGEYMSLFVNLTPAP